MNFDKNITMRIGQMLKSYDVEMNEVDDNINRMAEE
jgi:hypothetical protein